MEATLPIGLVGAGGVPVHRKSPEMRRPGAPATSSGGRALCERVRGDKRRPAGRGHSAAIAGGCGSSGSESTEAPSSSSRKAGRSRSEEHTSELQSLMRISYAVFCLKKKKTQHLQNRC